MTAGEVMTRGPVSVRAKDTVNRAIHALRELDVRHLPVVNPDGELVGMLSDRDLRDLPLGVPVADQLMAEPHPSDRPISSVMSGDVLSVFEESPIDEVIDLMVEHRIGAVPVVTPEGRLVGIVSYVDVLRQLARKLAEE